MDTRVIGPAVVGSLYPLIGDYLDEPGFDAVKRRAEELSLDRGAMRKLGVLYSSAPTYGIEQLDAADHLFVPAWLLSAASATAGSRQFAADLRAALLDAGVSQKEGGPATELVFNGWSLGVPAEGVQTHVAAHPVAQLLSEDVTLAYQGLVEHVRLIHENHELACNAVIWRVAGVLEALVPIAKPTLQAGVDHALKVIATLNHSTAAHEFNQKFANLTAIRNALTHLIETEGGYSFKTVYHHGHELGTLLVEAATLVVFETGRRKLEGTDPRNAEAALEACMHELAWIEAC